jgi:2-succinyl-6-hydroxy-2,4-cyclohexadiene-1-carboxylate synthase
MTTWLLHGAVGDASDWDSLLSGLDVPGSAAVDLYDGEFLDYDDFAAQLCSRAQPGDVLIGYSMGGRLALHALVHPQAAWSRAVIISADPGSGTDPERVDRDQAWANLAREDWEEFCQRWAAQPVFGGSEMPWTRDFSERRREAVARGLEVWSVGRQRDLRAEIERCGFPILWIVGENDEKFVRLAASVPGVEMVIVGGAAHRAPWEKPEATAEVIRSFLS